MPILEKSYAKFDQNYERIEGGYGREGLRTLTGMPTFMVYNDPSMEDELYPVHKYIADHNYPSVASCCNDVEGGIDGLSTQHAYTLLDVAHLTDDDGNIVHTIAKMRNPWSREKYIGKWNDDDPVWTEKWKKQVDLQNRNDGHFWMPYSNFLKFFRFIDVAYYRDDYKTEYHYFEPTERDTYWRMHNPVDQEVYITGEVYSGRHFPRNDECQPKTNIRLYLRHADRTPVEPLRTSAKINKRGFATVGKYVGKLPKGEYQFRMSNRYHESGGQKNMTIQVSATQ